MADFCGYLAQIDGVLLGERGREKKRELGRWEWNNGKVHE